jgi:RHS repeat-associated protein
VGSLRAISDSSGTIVKQIDYDSFGNVISDTNISMTTPFGFAGGLYDYDTGLVRFGFRDYDPAIGRWTAKDPIDFAGGNVNLFGYVENDPVNFIDPTGLIDSFPGSYSLYLTIVKLIARLKFSPFVPVGPFGTVCGPEGRPIARFIPDKIFGVGLSRVCLEHDRCYRDQRGRIVCDEEFRIDLQDSCSDSHPIVQFVVPNGYYWGVRAGGRFSY